jgi:preprotein translocase subunit SecF
MFTGKFRITLCISIAIIAAGVICAVAMGGLNLGLDFTGGSLTTIDIKADFDTDVIKDVLARHDAADSPVVKSGEGYREAVIRMRDIGDDELQSTVTESIMDGIRETYPDAALIAVDRVGGVTSADLVRNAFLAVLVSCGLMLVYIWIRFELFSGVAAVIALAHDVLIMIAVVAMTQVQINSGFIAACLTIVGYSINNTIVIFDRIRDNKKMPATKNLSRKEITDISVRQTLSRTINTSVTTLITIVCLYIFGVDSIKEFSLPIIVGLIAGTYSSVFLSGSVWAILADRLDGKNLPGAKKQAAKKSGKKSAAKA